MQSDTTARQWLRIIGWGFVAVGVLAALNTVASWMMAAPNTLIVDVSSLVWAGIGYGLLKQYSLARTGAVLLAAVTGVAALIAGGVMFADLSAVNVVLFGTSVALSPLAKGLLVGSAVACIIAMAGGVAYVLSRPRVTEQFR